MAEIIHQVTNHFTITGKRTETTTETFTAMGRLDLGTLRELVRIAEAAGFPAHAGVFASGDMIRVEVQRLAGRDTTEVSRDA